MNFNFISKMSQKEKLGLAAAVVIIGIALLDRVIAAPLLSGFKKLNYEIKTSEQQLAQSLRNLGQKEDISGEYQKYLQYIKSNYSEGEEINKLLEEIERMARNSGISINDIKPQPPKQVDIYKYYIIEIDVEGKMETLLTFLHQLSSSKELFRATKVYISLKDKETSTAKASILVNKVVVP